MDAQEMRMFSSVCASLEGKLRRLVATGEAELPFDPLDVAEALSVAAKELTPGPAVVRSK